MRVFLALLLVAMAACTILPDETADHDPAAIRDAYLIAHGMAKGYSERADADPTVMAQLRTLDRQAAAAVDALEDQHGGSPDETARAVAALTNYAAAQTPASP